MKNLVVLVPSRNRPQNIANLIKSFDETETESDLIVIVDDDEPQMDAYFQFGCDVLMVEKRGKGMAKPLNFAARHYAHKYRHFAFLGDDNRPRTKNWDLHFINTLDELGTGIVYGNDLFQRENLPTAAAMTGDIVNALGGMVPPNMTHLYLDKFWLRLGRDLNAIRYLPEVIIEHLHPAAGKAQWDEQYREVNSEQMYASDSQALETFLASDSYKALVSTLKDEA
jgi:Glycosyl transferase family 2